MTINHDDVQVLKNVFLSGVDIQGSYSFAQHTSQLLKQLSFSVVQEFSYAEPTCEDIAGEDLRK